MADWLPEGWEVVKETTKNGSKKEYYTNKATGQVFNTKEAMLRYANYATNITPHLDGDSKFKTCYMDEARYQYVDRPWEHGNEHKLHDYIVGNVGKVGDLKASGSSSDPTDEAMPAQKPEEVPNEKVLTKSSGQSSGTKLRKKKRTQKKR